MKFVASCILVLPSLGVRAKSSESTKSGRGNAAVFDPSHSITVDADCKYTAVFKLNIKDAGLSVPTSADDCSPTVKNCVNQMGEKVSCLDAQENFYGVSKSFNKHTGFDHISIDYNPCGHPPMGTFTIPHFDFHFYRATLHELEAATCDMATFAPICAFPGMDGASSPVQSTNSGRAFFVIGHDYETGKPANMPETFEPGLAHAVPKMGLHAFDPNAVTDQANWVAPTLVMGTYDGGINFWEPMSPLSFHVGDTDNSYSEDVSYSGQTIKELPESYSVTYDASSGVTTFTLEGTSAACSA